MDQLKKLFLSLTVKQRISLGVAAAAAIIAILLFSHWNRERDFKPLYTGLAQEDSAAVLAKVRESGTEFRIGDGGSTVMVPSAKANEIRLQLAAAGVPKSGRIGFEIFDKTNFGTSDFTEQINFHRALEGELERSIMALAAVEQARVHLTFPKDSVFLESKQPGKASVLLKLRPGSQLAPQNVFAICQLMASAVEGLAPEAVTVVDMRGNLLSRPRQTLSPDSPETGDATLEYKSKIEHELIAKIGATLDPLLGAGKFRTGVSVECDFSSGEQSEETFDPGRSVMTNSQKSEDMSGGNPASGTPGTQSNLPRPASRPGAVTSSVLRRTENISYQSSRVVRKVRMPQGGLKRMSVSILVDNIVRFEGRGARGRRIVEPPAPETLKAIRELVAGVIGFSAERGDQLVIESLPFESTLNYEPPAPPAPAPAPGELPAWLQDALKNKTLVIAGAAGTLILILALGLAVFFLQRRKRARARVAQELAAAEDKKNLATGEDLSKKMEAQLAEQLASRDRQQLEALSLLKLPQVVTKKAEVLTKHISEEARKNPQVMAQILRSWINEGNS